jgi:hypothetical protein
MQHNTGYVHSFPLWIREELHEFALFDFVNNFDITITNCSVCKVCNHKKHAFYRLRLTYIPTNRTMFITFQNQLDAFEPPHIVKEDVIICLNADLLWWYEGAWCVKHNGLYDYSYRMFRRFYDQHNFPYSSVHEFILFRNEVICLKKVLGDDFEAFYFLPF